MAELAALLASLPADSRQRGRSFELVVKWYLENDPVYAALLEHVWLWNDWPGRWGADAGIDLVAASKTGELWAIQAKAYDSQYAIKKQDVDTFLSESSRSAFAFRLLVTTTDHLGPRARATLLAQEKPAEALLRTSLEQTPLEWPSSLDCLAQRPIVRRPLRQEHQSEAIAAALRAFAGGATRAQVLMACGTGKTLVGAWLSEELRASLTIVLIPSLSLLSQTVRAWSAGSTPFNLLAVCSDQTTVDEDELVSSTADLAYPATTDRKVVESFLGQAGERRVIFSTYQSSAIVGAALIAQGATADLVIADEAHRCVAATGPFSVPLDDSKFPASRRLFMTATPRYFGSRSRRGTPDDLDVFDMSDEAAFGVPVFSLPFGEAIRRELLTDYQVVIAAASDSEIVETIERGRLLSVDGFGVVDARAAAAAVVTRKAVDKFDLKKIISFHSRIVRAASFARLVESFSSMIPSADRLTARHISGLMPTGARDVMLREFRTADDPVLLSNARCLAEGVDIPEVDCVAFVDPRRSQLDVVQAVGRAIRRSPGKSVGTILVPVLVQSEDASEDALAQNDHAVVWGVLRALRAHDEEFAEELDEFRRQIGRGVLRPDLPRRLVIELPGELEASFIAGLEATLLQGASSSWYFWFGLLERFVARDGHAAPPTNHEEDGWRLGQWVVKQRLVYNKGGEGVDRKYRTDRLSSDQIELLGTLPGWTWNPVGDSWEAGYASLVEYASREGSSRVPPRHREDGFSLGRWVGQQREEYLVQRLSKDRVDRLESLPLWSWTVRGDAWETRFQLLVEFVDEQGHARVPLSHLVGDIALGEWVRNQCLSHFRGRMKPERARRLESLPGWDWTRWPKQTPRQTTDVGERHRLQLERRWQEMFEALADYFDEHGVQRLEKGVSYDGKRLGTWISEQRRQRKAGRLTAERIAQLESLPGWSWSVYDDWWQIGYDHLVEHTAKGGSAQQVTQSMRTPDGYKLGFWVVNQRRDYRDKRITPERRALLDQVPGWSWVAPRGPTRRRA